MTQWYVIFLFIFLGASYIFGQGIKEEWLKDKLSLNWTHYAASGIFCVGTAVFIFLPFLENGKPDLYNYFRLAGMFVTSFPWIYYHVHNHSKTTKQNDIQMDIETFLNHYNLGHDLIEGSVKVTTSKNHLKNKNLKNKNNLSNWNGDKQ